MNNYYSDLRFSITLKIFSEQLKLEKISPEVWNITHSIPVALCVKIYERILPKQFLLFLHNFAALEENEKALQRTKNLKMVKARKKISLSGFLAKKLVIS